MITFINLTPHAINVLDDSGVEHKFPPSGELARVSSCQEKLSAVGGFSVSQTVWGELVGVPEPIPGHIFIVSGVVLGSCRDRSDVVGPDSGPNAIRNEKGQIVAVRGFVK